MTAQAEDPPGPPGRDFTATWRTGPPDALVDIQVWGRQAHRDALLRIVDGDGYLDAGTLSGGGTDDAMVVWLDEAAAVYSTEWLDAQEREAIKALSIRWGTV